MHRTQDTGHYISLNLIHLTSEDRTEQNRATYTLTEGESHSSLARSVNAYVSFSSGVIIPAGSCDDGRVHAAPHKRATRHKSRAAVDESY